MSLPWNLVIEALSWIELERLSEDAAIRKTVKQLRIDDKEAVDEARELVYETVRRLNTIDYIVNSSLDPQSLGNQKIGVQSYLRLFTYLSQYSGKSLADAYELTEHVRELFRPREMRKVEHAVDMIPLSPVELNTLGEVERLAYTHFHPRWYVEYLQETFGGEMAVKLMEHVDYPQYLRVNTLRGAAVDVLQNKGFQLVEEPPLKDCYRILGGDGITDTPEYKAGQYVIQDKASLLVAEVVKPQEGDIVLDVCAAPGVKTSHMAQLMNNTGKILSVDYNLRRLKNWENLMDRLGVRNAKPLHADAAKPGTITGIEADLVVIDPPCTGSGLFHKNPSSKWRLTRRSINTMAGLQRRILENASSYLRDGGNLVYSTCSITLEENEGVVGHFLENHPEYELVEADPRVGLPGMNGLDKAQRLYPHVHECNGFFIAKLVKSL